MSSRPTARSLDASWCGMHTALERFVERRTASSQDAEDVVQDVFLRIHLALRTSGPIDRVDAWMYRIARNALIDRHRRTRPVEPLDAELSVEAELEADELDALREALAAWLVPLIEQLPEPYASAVRMTEVEGLTGTEAARRAGLSISGMKSRVQRGRVRLLALVHAACRLERDGRGKIIGFESRGECRCAR